MKRVGFGLAIVLFTACAPRSAKAPEVNGASKPLEGPELAKEVQAMLEGNPRIPTEEDWKRVGPNALAVLEEVAHDSAAAMPQRLRAVACMSQVNNPLAVASLRRMVLDEKEDVNLRAAGAQSLAFRAGNSELATLLPLLAGRDAVLREAAARALGQLSSPEAKQALETRLEVEEEAPVREAIQKSLTALEP
jgi:HEAT repeat protein